VSSKSLSCSLVEFSCFKRRPAVVVAIFVFRLSRVLVRTECSAVQTTHLTSSDLVSADLVSSELVAATPDWVVRREATQFSVAATNRSTLSSDKTRSVEIRSDEARWEMSDKNPPVVCVVGAPFGGYRLSSVLSMMYIGRSLNTRSPAINYFVVASNLRCSFKFVNKLCCITQSSFTTTNIADDAQRVFFSASLLSRRITRLPASSCSLKFLLSEKHDSSTVKGGAVYIPVLVHYIGVPGSTRRLYFHLAGVSHRPFSFYSVGTYIQAFISASVSSFDLCHTALLYTRDVQYNYHRRPWLQVAGVLLGKVTDSLRGCAFFCSRVKRRGHDRSPSIITEPS